MAENTRNRLTRLLLSKSRRAQYIKVFSVLAACVVVAVAIVLHQNGVAMTHEEQVLTCPVSGVVAHTHNESCYDKDGNLVCTLPERELHVHDDSCYTETRTLICGQEESDEHQHTDACYNILRDLTCGKEEVTEEHVHGPGCFTTVTVQNEETPIDAQSNTTETGTPAQDAVDAPVQAAVAMPAQRFEDQILDEDGKLWVHVSVVAPEGAFPEGTTMKIAPLDAETVRTKVEDAIKKDDIRVTGAKQMKAVDITFFDKDGNEIEPAIDVEVKLTSDTVRDIEKPVLVHVDKDEAKDAEVLKKVEVVNQNEEDKTKGKEDTLKFESNEFSPYVIVEPTTISANVITASGEKYAITVSYGEDAGIPSDAKLVAKEIVEGEEGYDAYASETAQAVDTDVENFEHLRVFDISIVDAGGDVLEPTGRVEVKIEYVNEGIEEAQELKVVHLADEGTQVIDPTTAGSDGTTDVLTFTTNSFSIYSVVTWTPSTAGDNSLDGQSFAIVHVSEKSVGSDMAVNKKRHMGQAMGAQVSNGRLSVNSVIVEGHESGTNVVTSTNNGTYTGSDTVTQWFFKSVAGGKYKIYTVDENDEKYLKLTWSNNANNRTLALVDDENQATSFVVTPGDGNHAGMVRISDGNNHYVRSNRSSQQADNTQNDKFEAGNSENNLTWLTLCQIQEEIANNQESVYNAAVYSGKKVSVSNLENGHKYIVYKTVFNNVTQEYEDYAIDGNGNLIKAYDKGDVLTFHSPVSPAWQFEVLGNNNGATAYYIFQNVEGAIDQKDKEVSTNKILHPTTNTIVADRTDESTTKDGVRLTGREKGSYNSAIELWDSNPDVSAYIGYQIVWDDTEQKFVLRTGANEGSQEFMFAEIDEEPTTGGQPHEVATVDSVSHGITIHMFDYDKQRQISDVTGSDDWGQNTLQTNYVQPTLDVLPTLDKNGYPVYNKNNIEKSGKTLFQPSGNYYKGTANHLFLQSVYDSTGYYEYSCFNNFAQYNASTHNFAVYEELGSAQGYDNNYYNINKDENYTRDDGKYIYDKVYKVNKDDFNVKRGNFMPFNELDMAKTPHNTNQFNGVGDLLDYEDPMGGDPVYQLKGSPNWYFGMTMAFDFMMAPDGLVNGQPMKYEFYGDDDLLIYIDGVLVLNIDGRHDAWPGSIDFTTGRIVCPQRETTTIKDCFEAAGIYPDGKPWGDGSRVDEFFKGDTLIDYSGHSFKMFYMEHGAYASNLMMRFNLPTVESGEVVVEKQLTNAQADYANTEYRYKLFVENDQGEFVSAANQYQPKYEGTDTNVPVDNDGVFKLKPGEAAKFSDIEETREYYVEELDVDSSRYTVYINNQETSPQSDGTTYQSSTSTVKLRPRVVYKNECTEAGVNELHITKRLADGTPQTNDTFEFRVLMEKTNGELKPYTGEYCVRDEVTKKYYKNGTLVDEPYMYPAGTYGTIDRIPANATIIISGLVEHTDFFVDEIRMRENNSDPSILIGKSEWILESRVCDLKNQLPAEITNTSIYSYVTEANEPNKSSLGAIKQGCTAQVTFTNKLNMAEVDLHKVDENDESLNGATFKLTRWNGNTWDSVESNIQPGGTDEQGNPKGIVTLHNLRKGTYCLEETGAPTGYTILDNKYTYFKVEETSNTDNTLVVSLTDAPDGTQTNNSHAHVDFDQAHKTYTVVVKNTPGKELPATGGMGTGAYYAVGTAVTAAGLLYGFSRRRYAMRKG